MLVVIIVIQFSLLLSGVLNQGDTPTEEGGGAEDEGEGGEEEEEDIDSFLKLNNLHCKKKLLINYVGELLVIK